MATLREEAQAYEPTQIENIATLEKIPVELDLKNGEATDKAGETFKFKYIEIDGKQIRVPGSVIGGIKGVLEKMPHIKHVTVSKQGEGMNTRYQVMPYVEAEVEKVE